MPDKLVSIHRQPQMKSVIDNRKVAVLTRVNELAERHGLKPCDFVATFRVEENAQGIRSVLQYEAPVLGNALREAHYDRMLKDIGIFPDSRAGVLKGETAAILKALDNALILAPRQRLDL
jgi:hypothetical protein